MPVRPLIHGQTMLEEELTYRSEQEQLEQGVDVEVGNDIDNVSSDVNGRQYQPVTGFPYQVLQPRSLRGSYN